MVPASASVVFQSGSLNTPNFLPDSQDFWNLVGGLEPYISHILTISCSRNTFLCPMVDHNNLQLWANPAAAWLSLKSLRTGTRTQQPPLWSVCTWKFLTSEHLGYGWLGTSQTFVIFLNLPQLWICWWLIRQFVPLDGERFMAIVMMVFLKNMFRQSQFPLLTSWILIVLMVKMKHNLWLIKSN